MRWGWLFFGCADWLLFNFIDLKLNTTKRLFTIETKNNGAFIVMNVLVSVNYKCNTERTITIPSIHRHMYCSVANEILYRIPMINDDVFSKLVWLDTFVYKYLTQTYCSLNHFRHIRHIAIRVITVSG